MYCPTCHQPILPEYYFCPTCGTKLHAPPLATNAFAQFKLYAHSIMLPFLMFITISKWGGVRYIRSEDTKARYMGYIAAVLLIVSTIAIAWYTIYATKFLMQLANQTLENQ